MWIFNPLTGKFETTDSNIKPLSKVSIPNWLGLDSNSFRFEGDKTYLNLYIGNPLWKERVIRDLIKGLRFSYRREVTVTEQSGNDLMDYQVLIELNSSNFDFSHSDGNDIRFYNGEVFLPYWVEKWDSVNQEAKIWVKVPSISANGTVSFYMYYGNPVLLSASSPELTFVRVIDGCVLALPMDEGSGDTVYDKSGNDNDGTIYGGATWTDGRFGKALDLDGTDDYVEVSSNESLNIKKKLTISMRVNFSSLATKMVLCAKFQSGKYDWLFWIDNTYPDELRFYPEYSGPTSDPNQYDVLSRKVVDCQFSFDIGTPQIFKIDKLKLRHDPKRSVSQDNPEVEISSINLFSFPHSLN